MTNKKATAPTVAHGSIAAPILPVPDAAATPAARFLELLGKEPATTRLRAFPHKESTNKAKIGARKGGWDLEQAAAWNRQGRGVFVVTGNGGDKIEDITSCPALFVEWDDQPIEWQLTAWIELGLPEPTMQVPTGGRSVHNWWVMAEPISPADFEALQIRLYTHCKSDKLKDPSRVMRLPGFAYIGPDDKPAGMVELVNVTGNRYTAADFEACLPAIEAKPAPQPPARPLGGLDDELPPRPHGALRDALNKIPPFTHGAGQRPELVGLALRLQVEVGAAEAQQLLSETCCQGISDLRGYFNSKPTKINPGSVWPFLRETWGIDLTRHDLKSNRLKPQRSSAQGPAQLQLQRAGEGIDPNMDLQRKPERRGLAPDEVMQLVPQRLGELPRLNIRTNDFEAGGKVYTADDLGRLYLHLSDQKERWPKETTADAVVELAKNRAFDPVEEELNRISETVTPLPMEQWQRLDQHLLGIDDPIAAAFLPQFLVSAVARVYRPGCGVRRSPILIGPQWRGKTALGKILFGQDHWVENVSELGKDDLLRLQAGWGVELSEINGITARKDQEALKAFLTATNDVFRAPYGKGVARYQRRCVFWGTSNGPPLRDLSGSTRFVCIAIPDQMLPLDWAIEHREQLWSRAVAEFRQVPPGDAPWDRATETERLAVQERNANHQELDPWTEAVMSALTKKRQSMGLPVPMGAVFDELEIDVGHRTNTQSSRIRAIAEANGWTLARRRPAAGQPKKQGFWPPNPGHPGHPPGHPDGHPDEASQGKGFQPVGTPGTPNQRFLDEKEGEMGGAPPHPPFAVALPVHRKETFTPLGVPGVPSPPNESQRRGSNDSGGGAQGVPRGVPRVPDWHQRARLLRAVDPAMACATLALKLQTELGVTVTGRQVRELLAQEVKTSPPAYA